jgi:hypothetical protein
MKYLFTGALLILAMATIAQANVQDIRGTIADEDSGSPIPGATIIINNSDPLTGTISEYDGTFLIADVPVGRVELIITCIGFEPRSISNLLITSGKEVIVNVPIKESITQLQAAEITTDKDKRETLNEMAIVSSRAFTVEETQRYAGSFNDAARMVSSFAGVSSDAEGDNDIVVRGNSPKGILWRLEGLEIPNPNHFANEGATGGPINALNGSMLADSDFMTGAFEAEYGNATSGVFDMQLRNGNNQQREYSFSFGAIGTEFTAEGPISAGSKASYLANYRYSSLSLLDNAGIVDFGGVPKYQDGAFKVNVPTDKLGTFSLWGFGGLSHIVDEWQDTSSTDAIQQYRDDYSAHTGAIALNHVKLLNDHSYIKSNVMLSANGSGYTYEENLLGIGFSTGNDITMNKWNTKYDISYNNKINSRNRLKTGVTYTSMNYLFDSEYRDSNGVMMKELETDGSSGYIQAFASWKHRLTETVTLVGGVHGLYFALNETYSIEPRLAANWMLSPQNTLSIGAGLHSRMESLLNYHSLVVDDQGEVSRPNTDLELPKSAHLVAGWDHSFNGNTHIKTELYYQHLYNVPIDVNPTSHYSLINQSDWFTDRALVSEGLGRNYGLELTLERFLSNGLYYLVTTSLYESQYQNQDGVWRKTKFNGNYIANVLVGKEFDLKTKNGKDRTLAFNLRGSLLGGDRYNPIDLQASEQAGEAIRVAGGLTAKGDDVFFVNVGTTYRVNRPKATHEIKLEVLNASNHQARVNDYYNDETEAIEYSYQLGLIPNIIYTVNF